MENYYNTLNVPNFATRDEIINAYEEKIDKYNNLAFLLPNQISEIKKLKTALFILSNPELRYKYDNSLTPKNNDVIIPNVNINDINNNEPLAQNTDDNNDFNSVFNIDNSWMKQTNITNTNIMKNRIDTNIISDRIFSLSHLNNRPGYSNDVDLEIRKPLQGRIDKTEEL